MWVLSNLIYFFLQSDFFFAHLWGFLSTKMTESPLRNSFVMYLSFFMGFDFFPWDPLGTSVHISKTFSSTIFMWRSNALTLARILRLLRRAISTCVLALTALKSSEKGPYEKVSSGVIFCFSSSILLCFLVYFSLIFVYIFTLICLFYTNLIPLSLYLQKTQQYYL